MLHTRAPAFTFRFFLTLQALRLTRRQTLFADGQIMIPRHSLHQKLPQSMLVTRFRTTVKERTQLTQLTHGMLTRLIFIAMSTSISFGNIHR